jgi:hypothetical protein
MSTVNQAEMPLFLVFDVESCGLYGDGFAVGWTVVDLDGKECESGLFVSDWREAKAFNQKGVTEWLEANLPSMEITHQAVERLYFDFFNVLQRWLLNGRDKTHAKVSSIWADWGYPVETKFLARCRKAAYWMIEDDPSWLMPAPLQEIATLRMAAGFIGHSDPRLPEELPEHNPLNDARYSARIMLKALARLKEQSRLASDIAQAREKAIADSRTSARAAAEYFSEQVRKDLHDSGIGE